LDDGLEAIQQQPVTSSAAQNEACILACRFDLVTRGSIGSYLAPGEGQIESKKRHQKYQHVDHGASTEIHQNPRVRKASDQNDTSISDTLLDMTNDLNDSNRHLNNPCDSTVKR
jgi:hypothetical protein